VRWVAAVLGVPFIGRDSEQKGWERGGHLHRCTFNADHFLRRKGEEGE
jgi:hypothetical protein